MSAAPVTAYLSPTILRKRAISSGESGGRETWTEGWTIFILVSCSYSVPPHRGAAQPVVDGFAEAMMRDRHHRDGARAAGIEDAKIAEKIGGGLLDIAPRWQLLNP